MGLVPRTFDDQCLALRNGTPPYLNWHTRELRPPRVYCRLSCPMPAQHLAGGGVHDLVDGARACHRASLPEDVWQCPARPTRRAAQACSGAARLLHPGWRRAATACRVCYVRHRRGIPPTRRFRATSPDSIAEHSRTTFDPRRRRQNAESVGVRNRREGVVGTSYLERAPVVLLTPGDGRA
jgi:hypothetical protein